MINLLINWWLVPSIILLIMLLAFSWYHNYKMHEINWGWLMLSVVIWPLGVIVIIEAMFRHLTGSNDE